MEGSLIIDTKFLRNMKSFAIVKIFNSFFKILLIAQLLFLFSCDKPNLDGHWHVYYGESREPTSLLWDIRNDSLLSKYSYSLGPDSFKLGQSKMEIILPEERHIYNYVYFGDSCLLYQNDTLQLVLRKKQNCKLYEHEVALKINLNLPVVSENEVRIIDEGDGSLSKYGFIYIGHTQDSSRKECIQLNDRLSKISDLLEYLDVDYYQALFLIDKNIKMKLIDELLLKLRYNQNLRISFAFEVQENKSKIGLLTKKYLPIGEEIKYYPNFGKNQIYSMPPPPPQRINLFKVDHLEAFSLELKQNELIFHHRKVDYNEIRDSIRAYFNSQVVKNKAVNLIFEWDTASVFDNYAKISVMLKNARKDYQKKTATLKFNKTYEELSDEEIRELMKDFPVNFFEISPADRYAINKKKSSNNQF